MARSDRDFFLKFLDRAVPGSGRLLDSVDSLGDRIDDLQKKLEGVDEVVDERVAKLERRIDKLTPTQSKGRPSEQPPPAPEPEQRGPARHAEPAPPEEGA
jgi:hypothetical protein